LNSINFYFFEQFFSVLGLLGNLYKFLWFFEVFHGENRLKKERGILGLTSSDYSTTTVVMVEF
jgi:hypothetical protein